MRELRRAALLVACGAGLGPATLLGQHVRGTVRDSASREPIGGAVVTLSDAAGKFLARSVADAQGRYLVLRVLGAARLHVIRIGFHPWDGVVSAVPADSIVDVRMASVPVVLTSITSTGQRVCPGHEPESHALDLWDQARAALLSMVVSREAHTPRVRLLSVERTRDPVLKEVTDDSVALKDMLVDRSYVAARPAWVLASQGYIRERGGDREYFAPDETVLLDTTFAETHCLSVVRGEDLHEGEVGIRFDAVRGGGRDTLVDIDGVLWLDRVRPALRSLQYRYTGLEPVASGAGGEVHFAMMPTGAPMIVRWTIRTPVIATEQAMSPNGITKQSIPRAKRTNSRVIAYTETGGALVAADWDNGLHWHAAYPRIVGTVIDSAHEPVPGARVWIASDTVDTDSLGRFALPYVLDGIYVVSASDSSLAREGISRTVPKTVTLLASGDLRMQLQMHSRDEVLTLACPAGSYHHGTGALFARLVDSTGAPVPRARIDVTALQQIVSVDTLSRSVMRTGQTGDDGRFVICGADEHQPLAIQATKGAHASTAVVRNWGDGVVSLRLVLDRDER